MGKFAPLPKAEMDTAPIPFPERPDEGELVAPAPADAPVLPTHHRYGEPTARWAYRNEAGALLFWICRFDPPDERKQILPLTLWRDLTGELRWRWKAYPAPRPLYNLDKLAAQPDAPVVVVEGEKSADAATQIFSKSVVTTAPGGAQAATKADWSSIAGRRVLIWPDADAPGGAYGQTVAAILFELGCEVSIIDAVALASVLADGQSREPVPGWDAADAVTEWGVRELRHAAYQYAEPFEPGPSYVSWGPFSMGAGGLTMEVTKGRGDKAETVKEWISAPFEVLGASRDGAGRDWGKWLRWRDGDGREHVRHVGDAELQGDAGALAGRLAGEGLKIDRNQQKALAFYLCGVTVKGRVTLVSRTGWHNVGGQDVFVLPGETIGGRRGERIVLDAMASGPYEALGTLDDWKSGVGALAADHTLAVLSISVALAGPLLHLAGQEGGGLNLFGPSSKGKTTILQAGASVWGRGAAPGYVRAWRATANGLEGMAASASDTALVLDELGVIEARDFAAAVYGLANGSGKARAGRDGGLREPKSWRVLVLSSGEVPSAIKLAEDRGRRARAGQMVRLLDIPADRGCGFGAFDNGGPNGEAATLSKRLKSAAAAAYGTAGPEFVRRLISKGIDGDAVRAIIIEFVAKVMPSGADGQVDRAAQRLGLIAAAGELATLLGVVPWREGQASDAASWAFSRWVEQRGGTEPAEARQAIETVRLIIEQHGDARFEPVDCASEGRLVNNRLGWRKGDGAEREWWIPSETWKADICAGLNPQFVAKALAERGFLRTQGSGGLQCKVNLGGTSRANAYVVLAAILEGGDDAA